MTDQNDNYLSMEGERSVVKYERSVITMTLYCHSSQVFSLDNCVNDTPTETGLGQSQWEGYRSVMDIKFASMYQ